MRCVAIQTRLNFESDIALPTPLEAVRSTVARAGGEVLVPKSARPLAAPIQVRVRRKRLGALVTARSWSIRSERLADPEAMLGDVLEQFMLAEGFFSDLPVENVLVTTNWTEPLSMGWSDLVQSYIQAFYRSATLLPETSDATVIFDVARDDGQDKYQSGPMQKRQLLSEYLKFWSADEPEVPDILFFFHHVSSTNGSGPIGVSGLGEIARSALSRATSFAEDHYDQFARRIGAS